MPESGSLGSVRGASRQRASLPRLGRPTIAFTGPSATGQAAAISTLIPAVYDALRVENQLWELPDLHAFAESTPREELSRASYVAEVLHRLLQRKENPSGWCSHLPLRCATHPLACPTGAMEWDERRHLWNDCETRIAKNLETTDSRV